VFGAHPAQALDIGPRVFEGLVGGHWSELDGSRKFAGDRLADVDAMMS
jgi:hypothetical protein